MAESTWTTKDSALLEEKPNRLKFVIAGVIIAAVIVALVYNAVQSTSQLYITVDEYFANQARYDARDVRVAGWVVEDSVIYTQIDAENSRLEFEVVENLEAPGRTLRVVALNEPKPDLLHGAAQAVAIGRIGDDGSFYVEPGGLLLKCPTRYEELEPEA